MFAEDLGLEFDSFASESWNLVLLFILTELKRGFTYCLKEKAGIRHPDVVSCSSQATISMSVFDLPCNDFSTISDCHDVRNDVTGNDVPVSVVLLATGMTPTTVICDVCLMMHG